MTEDKDFKSDAGAPQVGIVMCSDSDLDVMQEAASILKKFDIPYEMTVASAHRSPQRTAAEEVRHVPEARSGQPSLPVQL